MSDQPSPRVPGDRDAELCSAYLAAELEPGEARRFEQRLLDEPQLAAQLEGMHDLLVRLRDLDQVTPPAGFEHRLAERLAAERADAATASPAVRDLAVRWERGRRSWATVGSVAAAVVALALLGGGLLQGLGAGGGGSTMQSQPAEGGAGGEADEGAEESALRAQTLTEAQDGGTEAADAEAAPEKSAAGAGGLPVIADRAVRLTDPQAVARRYRDRPEADAVLGEELDRAAAIAAEARDALAQAPAFSSGVSPDACAGVRADITAPVVPVRVETARYQGEPALVYVFVSASGDSGRLDRVEVFVVDPATCDVRLQG